jgi:hypothetical protein
MLASCNYHWHEDCEQLGMCISDLVSLCTKANELRYIRPKRCMIPDGLTTDSERKSLIRILRADARAAEAAERAERAEAVTVTITATESEDD